jgi:hypothetical protein
MNMEFLLFLIPFRKIQVKFFQLYLSRCLAMCVGIILPRDQPELEKHFVEVLNNYAIVKTSNIATTELSQEEQARLSEKIAAFSMKSKLTFTPFALLGWAQGHSRLCLSKPMVGPLSLGGLLPPIPFSIPIRHFIEKYFFRCFQTLE